MLEGERLRSVAFQRDVDDRERRLHRRVAIDLLLDDDRVRSTLEFDEDASLRVSSRVVVDVRDVGDPPVLPGFDRELFEDIRLDDLIGDLIDDEVVTSLSFLVTNPAAHDDATPPGCIGFDDPASTDDPATRGKVWSRHDLEQVGDADLGVVEDGDDRSACFPDIVRGHARSHADGDAAGAIHDEIRELCREYHRLGESVVVIRSIVDGAELDVIEHGDRCRSHSRLGVTHRSGWIAFDGTEVALLVDQERARLPRLAEVDQGRVNDALAMRVVVARGVACDLGALDVLASRRQVEVVHGHEDPTLRRLESVTDIGQGTIHDRAHGIRQVGIVEFAVDFQIDDAIARCLPGSCRPSVVWNVRGCHVGFFFHFELPEAPSRASRGKGPEAPSWIPHST